MNAARQRLLALHGALLRLHKALLDSERTAYEEVHGRIPSPGAFLQLVINDEWFAWLRELSELIVQIDEKTDRKYEPQDAEASQLFEQTRALLTPDENGQGFAKRYFEAMQRDSAVVVQHAAVLELLRAGTV
jgi:hypothetical protein